MRARVKATGEIVGVDFYTTTKRGKLFSEVTESKRWFKPDESHRKFYRDEIEFLSYEDTPDYWTRLEHQYAGMAMQGMLSNPEVNLDYKYDECMPQAVAATAYNIAHALVEKLKEKETK